MRAATATWFAMSGLAIVLLCVTVADRAAAQSKPATQPATSRGAQFGPETVLMDRLVNLYEPVPFSHRAHAEMAEMWTGCTTCHHRPPNASTQPATRATTGMAEAPGQAAIVPVEERRQEDSSEIPACRSCHDAAAESADIRMPNLKGAYHRQCLNCHREWMHANSCGICHQPKDKEKALAAGTTRPTAGDIVGRMHPPNPEPEVKVFKTRFTPADGGNVMFRHKEHSTQFGLKCVQCHHQDNCSHCHDGSKTDTTAEKPVKPGKTWRASHGPCMSCHGEDRCRHCHYQDDGAAPAAFTHAMTGQVLDKDHSTLNCQQCHRELKLKATPTCGDAKCHEAGKTVAFPEKRPGPLASTRPAVAIKEPAPTTQSLKPTVQKIRASGSGR